MNRIYSAELKTQLHGYCWFSRLLISSHQLQVPASPSPVALSESLLCPLGMIASSRRTRCCVREYHFYIPGSYSSHTFPSGISICSSSSPHFRLTPLPITQLIRHVWDCWLPLLSEPVLSCLRDRHSTCRTQRDLHFFVSTLPLWKGSEQNSLLSLDIRWAFFHYLSILNSLLECDENNEGCNEVTELRHVNVAVSEDTAIPEKES